MLKLKIIGDCREEDMLSVLRKIKWNEFNVLCSALGNEFNDPQWRFLKATFLEIAVSEYSDGGLIYVGDEQQGCDFIVPSLDNMKIEMKYMADCLYGKGKVPKLKSMCNNITLLNSKGTNKHINLPDSYADYLMVVEMRGCAIVSKEKLKQYVVSNGDSLSASIPTSELTVVCEPSSRHSAEKKELNIKKKILALIKSEISQIRISSHSS
jgi:hypothetical protein